MSSCAAQEHTNTVVEPIGEMAADTDAGCNQYMSVNLMYFRKYVGYDNGVRTAWALSANINVDRLRRQRRLHGLHRVEHQVLRRVTLS